MASIDDDSPPDLIKKKVVVLREGIVPQNKETNAVFMPSPGKLQEIKQDPRLCKEISFTKSMTSEDIKEVLKNAFPFLADTERFFCAKRVQKENQLDFCGERGIWDGQVLNRKIRGNSSLYIYCEEENSDQDPSLTAQMEKMRISRNVMASIDDDWPPGLIRKEVVVLRERVFPKNKETNAVFMQPLGKLRKIKRDPGLCKEISFTKSMTSEDIKEVLKNAFPFLAYTERFFCAKESYKAKLDFCGKRRIWSGEDLNREMGRHRVLYIYWEEENSDQDSSLESSSEDRSDSSFETCDIPEETSLSRSKIGDSKDSTSLEEVTSILKDKQQTEEQSGEDESESFEETLSENQATSPSMIDKGKDSTSPEEVVSVPVDKQQTEEQSGEDESESSKETLSVGPVLPELSTKMTLPPFTKEQVNYFKFANIVVNEFPKALRQSFEHFWNTTYGHRPGYRFWDDSEEVRTMFLRKEGGTTDVPTDLSYTEWDCSNLFRATIFSQSFSEEDSTGWKTSLSEKYVKSRPDRLAEGELFTSGKSGTSVTETFTIAINQLRILRNTLLNLPKAEIDTKEFEIYIQLSEKAFGILNVATASIKAICSYSEDDFPTEKAHKIKKDIRNDMRAELKFLAEEELRRSGKIMEMWNLKFGRTERTKELLERMMATLKERKKGLHELLELIESGVRLIRNRTVQTSLEYQVKKLRDDVNAELENVRPSASVRKDKKKLDQQLIEGETKLPEDASSESLATSPSTIDRGKDSTSLEEVVSVLLDKQQTERQSGKDKSESFEETLSVGVAKSPSTIDKGKDSTSLEELINVPMAKQQTEKQSGEDQSLKETLSENQATSPSMIDKGKDSTSLEEVTVALDKQQTERQSGEDESKSFKETLSVGPGAQDHDIKGKTTTFEAEHKECIRVLPYTDTSGQVYVHLYVFCDKNGIPKELEADAQEFFRETGVELKWSNMKNHAYKKPNIDSVDFKQLEVSQVNGISKIINRNLPLFSKHRNITAIQPSLKVTNLEQTNDPCIRVYVLGKGRVPFGESEIPNSVDDCPVDIVNGFWSETSDTPRLPTAHNQEKYLRLGASIGIEEKDDAGTLGAIVEGRDGGLYLLSCDHVIKHERERRITNPGWCHFLDFVVNRMTDYKTQELVFHPQPATDHYRLRSQIESACKMLNSILNAKLITREKKLMEIFSELPRTVAYYVYGIREDIDFGDGSKNYIDAAIAKLTKEEEEALKENGRVEIIDTVNYPNGKFTMDESQGNERELCKSGSSTGYTSLRSSFSFGTAFLRISEHERKLLSPSLDLWHRNCILIPNNENVFSYHGDSGAVIFEKSGQHPQAMPGFGIVIGGLFPTHSASLTIAVPLRVALDQLSIKLKENFKLVSSFNRKDFIETLT